MTNRKNEKGMRKYDYIQEYNHNYNHLNLK